MVGGNITSPTLIMQVVHIAHESLDKTLTRLSLLHARCPALKTETLTLPNVEILLHLQISRLHYILRSVPQSWVSDQIRSSRRNSVANMMAALLPLLVYLASVFGLVSAALNLNSFPDVVHERSTYTLSWTATANYVSIA